MESKKTVTTDSGAPVAHNKLMPAADEARHRFNPFDASNVWSHRDYPLITVGRIVLIRNPENCFAEVEQAAFNPAHFVPGIGPSPDKMLQGRLFSSDDTHRCRLGAYHTVLASQPAPRDPSRATTAAAARCAPTAMPEELRGLKSFGGQQQTAWKSSQRCG